MIEGLMVPEVTLYKLINGLILEIELDYNRSIDKKDSKLYKFWNGVSDGKYDYYKEAVALFTGREDGHPRKVSCRMFFDAAMASSPTMHITMPEDSEGENAIGVDESGYIEDIDIDNTLNTTTVSLGRRFDAKFHIICTSDNNREVLLMYHTLRAMVVGAYRSLEVAGLQNIKMSGQELRINDASIPSGIYMRGIGIHHSYDIRVPELFSEKIINQYVFNNGVPYEK